MTFEPIGMIALLLALAAFRRGPAFGMYVVLSLSLFRSSAALLLPALGGSTIQLLYFFIPFFILVCLFDRGAFQRSLSSLVYPNAAYWMMAITFYVMISALLFPRMFAGMTEVFSISRDAGIIVSALSPGGGNITQSAYYLVEFGYFVALLGVLPGRQEQMINAMAFAGILNLVLAVVDVVTYETGTAHLLEIFRNASYSQLTEGEILGFKRITGLFPEASAFGTVTLAFFAFFAQLWVQGVRSRLSGAIAGLSFVALAMSTSSSVYAVLAALTALIYLQCLCFLAAGRARTRHVVLSIIAPLVFVTVVLGLMLIPSVWATFEGLLDRTVVNKLSSQSGVERMTWNYQAWVNFVETMGFGAGVGSVRASSLLFAILGSIGVIGLTLYLILFAKVFRPMREFFSSAPASPVQQAALFGCLAILLIAMLIATGVSLRVHFLTMAALSLSLSGVASGARRRSSVVDARDAALTAPAGRAF